MTIALCLTTMTIPPPAAVVNPPTLASVTSASPQLWKKNICFRKKKVCALALVALLLLLLLWPSHDASDATTLLTVTIASAVQSHAALLLLQPPPWILLLSLAWHQSLLYQASLLNYGRKSSVSKNWGYGCVFALAPRAPITPKFSCKALSLPLIRHQKINKLCTTPCGPNYKTVILLITTF